MASYSTLRKSLLAGGLREAGFTVASEYLVRDMGECVGGIWFQKSKYDSAQFFLDAGVLSKRIDRFERRFTAADETRPYTWDRAQIRTRLLSDKADLQNDKWILQRTKPIGPLVDRLVPILRDDAVPLFDAFGTDEKMRDGLLARDRPHGYSLYRGHEWPERHAALVYAAVLIYDVGPKGDFEKTIEMALSAAKTPMEREWVSDCVAEIKRPVLNPEDMLPEEALEQLKELTGRDFGNDYEAWKKWLKANPFPTP